jgi:hypothetical protein
VDAPAHWACVAWLARSARSRSVQPLVSYRGQQPLDRLGIGLGEPLPDVWTDGLAVGLPPEAIVVGLALGVAVDASPVGLGEAVSDTDGDGQAGTR